MTAVFCSTLTNNLKYIKSLCRNQRKGSDFMSPIIYIVPVVLVLIIAGIGFIAARKNMPKVLADMESAKEIKKQYEEEHAGQYQIYELPGNKGQAGEHYLGAVQRVIRGRIRFVLFGLMLIGVALGGVYLIYIAKVDVFEAGDAWYIQLVEAILLLGGIAWGINLIYFSTCKIKLRRKGLEMCSILGTKSYEYKDISFRLFQTIEDKRNSDGYRPMVMKTPTFNWIWVCQIFINNENKMIEVKSSRYARLHSKITDLTQSLVWMD